MTRSPQPAYRYQVGGTLGANAPYVERQADETLFTQLQRGEFCYVFNCRQMGKSSLRARTMRRLMAEGIGCVNVDLTTIGTQVSTEQWYTDLIESLHDSFTVLLATGQLPGGDDLDLDAWQQQYEVLKQDQTISPVRRLHRYLKELLLSCLPQQTLVIFIDEIDNVLNLDFDASDFFALIRACFNQRADDPDYERLTFALFGVATPAQLIRDVNKTPFNLGKDIVLTGFEFERSRLLAAGLANVVPDPEAVLEQILTWTGGQPFLTQKLCDLIQMGGTAMPTLASGEEAAWVTELVRSHIIDNWENHDNPAHLTTIRDRLRKNEHQSGRLLGMYQQILQQGAIATDDSEEQTVLCLSGLVVRQDGTLRVYNPIYAQVFTSDWITQELAQLRPPEYAKAFDAWRLSKGENKDCLLQEQELLQALKWSADKRLSNEDYQFLAACQDAAKQQLEDTLNETKRKTRRQIRIGLAVLIASIVGALVAGTVAVERSGKANQATQRANQATQQLQTATQETQQITAEKKQIEKEKEQKERAAKVATQKQQQAEKNVKVATINLMKAKQNLQETQQDLQQTEQTMRATDQQAARAQQQAAQAMLQATRAKQQEVEAQKASKQAKLELAVTDVRFQAAASKESFTKGRDFEALLQALRAGQKLESLDQATRLQNETESQVVTALMQSVYGVKERNTLNFPVQTTSIRLSPDRKKIVTSNEDGTLTLWNLKGQRLRTFQAHRGVACGVTFSPDGNALASTGDGVVKVWTLDGQELQTFKVAQGCHVVDFNPDGKTLAVYSIGIGRVSGDTTFELWSINGKRRFTLAQPESFRDFKFSPNGKTFVVETAGGITEVWSLDEEKLLPLGSSYSKTASNVSFSPDGKTFTATDKDKMVKLWSLNGDKLLALQNSQDVDKVIFSPDGKTLAGESSCGVVTLWDRKGQELETIRTNGGCISDLKFSPDSKTLALANQFSGTIHLWNMENRELQTLKTQQGIYFYTLFSLDSKTLFSIGEDRTVRTVKSWNVHGRQAILVGYRGQYNSQISFSLDGKALSISTGSTAGLWSLDGKKLLSFEGNDSFIKSFSPDGKTYAQITPGGREILVRHLNGTIVFILESEPETGLGGSFESASFSPDGNTLAIVNNKNKCSRNSIGIITLWNFIKQEKQTIKNADCMTHVTFSRDGKIIASADYDGTIRLWSLDGKKLRTFGEEASSPNYLSFSRDGKIIASADYDGTIRLWSLDGKKLRTLKAGSGFFENRISFSPDGKILVWVGKPLKSSVAQLWSLNGEELLTLEGTTALDISPDGKTLAWAKEEGPIYLWSLELKTLMKLGCDWVRDYLQTNPNALESDRQMCGITKQK